MEVLSGAAPVLPLACHPYPVPPVVVQAIKEAKEFLCERDGLDFRLQISEAVPGNPTRVMAFRGPPPFMCDCTKLRNWQDRDELVYWLEWVLNPNQPVSDGFTQMEWLSQYLGPIRDVTDEMDGWELMKTVETYWEKEAELNARGRRPRFG